MSANLQHTEVTEIWKEMYFKLRTVYNKIFKAWKLQPHNL